MADTTTGLPRGARDPRLDLFRGLSLVMIYINHVPGTIYENFTSRNFGLSDAAEGFVFMSGCAVALAYGPRLADGLAPGAVLKSWGRAWTLYLAHLLTTVWAMAIVAGAVLWFGADEVLKNNSFIMMWHQPVEVTLGVATLGHQFGYVNILPMYAVLMLMAPFLVRLGQRSPKMLLGGSILFWVVTGELKLDLPNYPQPGGWFFNPFAWQLIFSLGILTGLGLRSGQRFVPVRGWLFWGAVAWLLFCLVWVKVPDVMALMNQSLARLVEAGVPPLLAGFDKTYVSLPRLAHFLVLAYVLSMPGLVPRIAAARVLEPIRLIGRHSLPVFAAGTVLAILAQTVKDVHPAGLLQDTVLVLGGVVLLWALARALDWNARSGGQPPRGRSITLPTLAPAPQAALR
ncbi:OpgC family protein [Paenirhodobacter sp.]|uniref:OpgC family protein n=1 Tax=Paenirhodobacter sp. TaxID=1965326 RepID=UPI003B3F24C4